MIALAAAGLLAWAAVSFTLAPLFGARLAGRRMTTAERDAVTWGGLGVFLALFAVASILIGARP